MLGKRRNITQNFKPIEKGFKVAGLALEKGRGHIPSPGMESINKSGNPELNGQNRTHSGNYYTHTTSYSNCILHRGGFGQEGIYFGSNVVRWKTLFLSKILKFRDCHLWLTTGDRPIFNIEDMEEWMMVEGHREMVVKDNWRGRGGEMKWGSLLRLKEQREVRFAKESGLVMDLLLHSVDHTVLSLMMMDSEFCARVGDADISYIFRLACRSAVSTSGTSTQLDMYSLSNLSIAGDDYVTFLTTFHESWLRIEQEGWSWDEMMERWLVAKITLDAKEAARSHWPLIGRLADRLIVGENQATHQEILDRWTNLVDDLETFESCNNVGQVVGRSDIRGVRLGSAPTPTPRLAPANIGDHRSDVEEDDQEARGDSRLRNAADWKEWDRAFSSWLLPFSDCRKWLREGERPVYKIKEFVPRVDEMGGVVLEAGEPVMVPNPDYVGDDGWENRREDMDRCEEQDETLGAHSSRAISKIWSTASKSLQTKIERQEGYRLEDGFVNDDLLWHYNAVKQTFDASRGLVIEGSPVQSAAGLMRRLMELKIEGSGSQALLAYTSRFKSLWSTVLRLDMTSEEIVKSWRNVCLVRPIWTHPKFEGAAEDIIMGKQWPQLEQLLTKLSLTCGEFLEVDRHVGHIMSKVSEVQVSGKRKKHHQATCHRCGRVGHIKRNCDLAEPEVQPQMPEVSGDESGGDSEDGSSGDCDSGGSDGGVGRSRGVDNGADSSGGHRLSRGDGKRAGKGGRHRASGGAGQEAADIKPDGSRQKISNDGSRKVGEGSGAHLEVGVEEIKAHREEDRTFRNKGTQGREKLRKVLSGEDNGEEAQRDPTDAIAPKQRSQKWLRNRRYDHSPQAIIGSLKSKEEREEASLRQSRWGATSQQLEDGQGGSRAVGGWQRISIDAFFGRFVDNHSDEDRIESHYEGFIGEAVGDFVRAFMTSTTKTAASVLNEVTLTQLATRAYRWNTVIRQVIFAFLLMMCTIVIPIKLSCAEMLFTMFVMPCLTMLCHSVLVMPCRHVIDVGEPKENVTCEKGPSTTTEVDRSGPLEHSADTVYVDTCADNHLWNHTASLHEIKPAVDVRAGGFTGYEKDVDMVGYHPSLGRVYVAYWAPTSLISMPRLIDQGYRMTCDGDLCEIRNKLDQVLLVATRDHTRMYGCKVADIQGLEGQPDTSGMDGAHLRCYMVTSEGDDGNDPRISGASCPVMRLADSQGEYGRAIGLGIYRHLSVKQDTLDVAHWSHDHGKARGGQGDAKCGDGEAQDADVEARNIDGEGQDLHPEARRADGENEDVDGEDRGVYGEGRGIDGEGRGVDGEGRGVDGEGRDVHGEGQGTDGEGKLDESKVTISEAEARSGDVETRGSVVSGPERGLNSASVSISSSATLPATASHPTPVLTPGILHAVRIISTSSSTSKPVSMIPTSTTSDGTPACMRCDTLHDRVSADSSKTLPSPIRGVSLASVDRDLSLDRSFRVGQDVFYCDPSGHGDKIPWRIVGVHWDAPPTPYYTIAREDDGGCREKQTSGERLQLCRPLSGSADTCEDVYPEGAKQAKGVRGKDSEFDVGINEAKEAMGGGSRNTASVGVYEDEIEEEEAIKNATHAQEISRYRLRRPSLWMVNDYSTDRLMVERYPYDNEEQSETLIDSILDACADITKPPMDSWGLLMVATKTGWRQLTRRPLKWDFMKSQQRSRRRGPSSEEREDFGAPHEEETSDQPLGDY